MIDKLVGVILIVLGTILIIYNYKYNNNKDDYFLSYWKGYLGGFFLIVIGILQTIGYFGFNM